MDIEQNINNIREQLVKMDNESKRLLGMLEVFETMQKMGVKVVKPESSDLNIMTSEEVVTINEDEK